MKTKPSILVVGGINSDLILMVDQSPAAGETVMGDVSTANGGKGANQAVAAARLGAKVSFVGCVGADENGRRILSSFEQDGIDTAYIKTVPEPTGLAAIVLEQSGQNRIVVCPGANSCISHETIEAAMDEDIDAVMLQLEIPLETAVFAAHKAIERGIPVVLDAAPASSIELERFEGLFIITPNETEAEILTGIALTDDASIRQAAQVLKDRTGAKYTVIKLGSRGSCVYDGNELTYYESYKVTPVDTTAAGDSYTAALTYEYCRTNEIGSAVQYANAVGALAVTKLGAQSSLPTANEVEEFVRGNG